MSNVPKLRFPGFEGVWVRENLSNILFEHKKRNFAGDYNKTQVLSVTRDYGLLNQIEYLGRSYAGVSVLNYHIAQLGDLVYTKSPLKPNPYGIIKANRYKAGIVSTLYAVYSIKGPYSHVFLDYYFTLDDHTNKYLRPLVNKGAKNDMKVNNEHVLTGHIYTTNIKEQTKIADFLSLIDKKITKQDGIVTALEQYKKGLMQKIFSREIRFKDDNGKDFPGWLWEQLLEVGEKIRDKNDDFRITNVISNSAIKGLIKQRDYFEKDIANIQNINNYYIIKHGDFVYNPRKSNEAPYGPIKIYKSYELGIVSPLYLCFRLKKEIGINEVYISYFFESKKWHKYIYHYADRGARYDRVSMQDTKFFEMKIPLPSNEEQTKIANFLSLYDRKIEKEKAKLEALREQKKGLLQQMFV